MEVRELRPNEYDMAFRLSWAVFQEYEAPDYSKQGADTFYRVIHDPEYTKTLRLYGAFDKSQLIGTIATRSDGDHIALFFVDGSYHGQGIGRQLFQLACSHNTSGQMTVNSSPFAVEIYHHLGFVDTDSEQNEDGMRYTPMRCLLEV